MGFNTTTKAIGNRLSSSAVGTSKSKPEQIEGSGGQDRTFWSQEQKNQFAPEFAGFDQEEIRCLG